MKLRSVIAAVAAVAVAATCCGNGQPRKDRPPVITGFQPPEQRLLRVRPCTYTGVRTPSNNRLTAVRHLTDYRRTIV